jgi:23S rRNA (adenine2503-C2)-methyltransferase
MVEALGEPAWRGRQLAEALYRQRIAELDEITTLPKALRQRLAAEGWQVGRPPLRRSSNPRTARSATWSRGKAATV